MLLDFYANNLSLPSKQITTGQQVNVGSPYKYATGTAFSQVNINYVIPRSQLTRTFFERWTQVMASDSNQYTDFYDNYVPFSRCRTARGNPLTRIGCCCGIHSKS